MLVDCGDFAGAVSDEQKTKVRYLLRGMSLLQYDAINLAEKDLQYGIEYLEEMQHKYNLPFISANIIRKDTGELFAKPYIIKQIGGIKTGIFGVSTTIVTAQVKAAFIIEDPVETTKKIVEKLKDKCDVIVALAHLGLEKARQLAQDVPDIDFVISGHRWDLSSKPEIFGKTVVMQPGSKGKYLGHIDFEFADGNVNLLQGRTVSLSSRINDDKHQAAIVREYDQKVLGTADTGTN